MRIFLVQSHCCIFLIDFCIYISIYLFNRFKYDSSTVKSVLFPLLTTAIALPTTPTDRPHDRKRRKFSSGVGSVSGDMDVDSDCAFTGTGAIPEKSDTILSLTPSSSPSLGRETMLLLENDEEQFLVQLMGKATGSTEEDKENRMDIEDSVSVKGKGKEGKDEREGERKGKRYNLYVVVAGSAKTGTKESEDGTTSTVDHNPDSEMTVLNDKDALSPNIVTTTIANAADTQANNKNLQLLYRDIGEESVDFRVGGLAILPASDAGEIEDTGKSNGWFLKVQRWKWAGGRYRVPTTVSSS